MIHKMGGKYGLALYGLLFSSFENILMFKYMMQNRALNFSFVSNLATLLDEDLLLLMAAAAVEVADKHLWLVVVVVEGALLKTLLALLLFLRLTIGEDLDTLPPPPPLRVDFLLLLAFLPPRLLFKQEDGMNTLSEMGLIALKWWRGKWEQSDAFRSLRINLQRDHLLSRNTLLNVSSCKICRTAEIPGNPLAELSTNCVTRPCDGADGSRCKGNHFTNLLG